MYNLSVFRRFFVRYYRNNSDIKPIFHFWHYQTARSRQRTNQNANPHRPNSRSGPLVLVKTIVTTSIQLLVQPDSHRSLLHRQIQHKYHFSPIIVGYLTVSITIHCHNTPANTPISSSRTIVTPAQTVTPANAGAIFHRPAHYHCHSRESGTRSEAQSRDSESSILA